MSLKTKHNNNRKYNKSNNNNNNKLCFTWKTERCSNNDADHLEFPLKQIGSEILSFQQAQDILIDIYYNCIWAHM